MTCSIRTIVIGVAELEPADPVLEYGYVLAGRLGASIHVVHAYQPPAYWAAGMEAAGVPAPPPFPVVESLELERILEERLKGILSSAPAGVRVSSEVAVGPADLALEDVSGRLGADLLLVGATRHGNVGRLLLGTTAGKTIRHGKAPVFVLRNAHRQTGARVLLTTDLSELNARAIRRGADCARTLIGDAEVKALYVAVSGPSDLPPSAGGSIEADAQRALRAFLNEWVPGGDGIPAVVRVGNPHDDLVAEAKDWGADLVVLGTHGRSGLSRLLLGSVAEAAVRDLECSALVVPPGATGEEEKGEG